MKEPREVALPCRVCGRPVEVTVKKAVEYLGPYSKWRDDLDAYLQAHPETGRPLCLEHWWVAHG